MRARIIDRLTEAIRAPREAERLRAECERLGRERDAAITERDARIPTDIDVAQEWAARHGVVVMEPDRRMWSWCVHEPGCTQTVLSRSHAVAKALEWVTLRLWQSASSEGDDGDDA